MIDLLILYSLKNRERTVYSLRSEILEKFGSFTKPSVGTIHPALKRLLAKNILTVRNDFSKGGKKSTYYGLATHAMQKFTDLFFAPLSDNPTIFFTEIQSRIAVMSMLDEELKETFLNDLSMKLKSFSLDLKNTLEDEYIKLDDFQTELLKKNIEDIEGYKKLVERLKK